MRALSPSFFCRAIFFTACSFALLQIENSSQLIEPSPNLGSPYHQQNPTMAAESDATTRRRKPEPKTANPQDSSEDEVSEAESAGGDDISQTRPARVKAKVDDEDRDSPLLDLLRVITFLFLASGGLSYLISGGETFFWGMSHPPNYLRVDWWKSQLVTLPNPLLSVSSNQAKQRLL